MFLIFNTDSNDIIFIVITDFDNYTYSVESYKLDYLDIENSYINCIDIVKNYDIPNKQILSQKKDVIVDKIHSTKIIRIPN